jgi:hypothetical protein
MDIATNIKARTIGQCTVWAVVHLYVKHNNFTIIVDRQSWRLYKPNGSDWNDFMSRNGFQNKTMINHSSLITTTQHSLFISDKSLTVCFQLTTVLIKQLMWMLHMDFYIFHSLPLLPSVNKWIQQSKMAEIWDTKDYTNWCWQFIQLLYYHTDSSWYQKDIKKIWFTYADVLRMMRPVSIFWPMPWITNTRWVMSTGRSDSVAWFLYPRHKR